MVQWTNLQRTKKFVNRTRLYITCEKSGGLHQGGTLSCMEGWQADEIWRGLKFQKLALDQNIQFSILFSRGAALFQQL